MSNEISLVKQQQDKFFQSLHNDNDSKDVTIVSDYGQIIKAHKLVLCAGSRFLNNILSDQGYENSWIYLSGVKHEGLKDMVNFLYTGEISTSETNFENFLKMAELLVVENAFQLAEQMNSKGLENVKVETTSVDSSKSKWKESVTDLLQEIETTKTARKDGLEDVLRVNKKSETVSNLKVSIEEAVVNTVVVNGHEIDMTENGTVSSEDEMFSVENGLWECGICEKTFLKKSRVKSHVQIHTRNTNSFTCKICGRSFGTQDVLRNHKNNVHNQEIFQCPTCGRANMTKVQFKNHKYQSKTCGVKHRSIS